MGRQRRMRTLFVLGLLLGCATTQRQRLGDIHLQPYEQFAGYPVVFSVQQGRLVSPDVDVTVEDDGCVRGSLGTTPVVLCMKSGPPPLDEGDKVERWSGTNGDFTVELKPDGKSMRVDGWVAGRSNLNATVPLGQGAQWDELRKHPALLAIAAAIAGVSGEPTANYQAQ